MTIKLREILFCIKMVNDLLLRNDREGARKWNLKADGLMKEYIKDHDGKVYVRAGDVCIGSTIIWIDREWKVKNKCHSSSVDLVLLDADGVECWISNNENVILVVGHHKGGVKPSEKKLFELNGCDYVILPGYGAVKIAVVSLSENYVKLSNDNIYFAGDKVKLVFEFDDFKFYELV